VDFQQWLEEDGFAAKVVFSDKATFHVCGKVNHHNVRMEHVRDSLKVNVTSLCNQNYLHKQLTRERLHLTRTMLKQNYFQFYDNTYAQTRFGHRFLPILQFSQRSTYNI
jgi:hypothetical protein